VNAFVTRKRFYAIVSLNNKKDEALEEKFLSSFVLPERQNEPPKTVATANGEQQPQNPNQPEKILDPNTQNTTGQSEGEVVPASDPATPVTPPNTRQPPSEPGKKSPINGGMLNGKAIYMPVPEAPAGDANGVVLVAVMVDEQGTVVDARAGSGPQHLQAAAVAAARLARFSPTLLMGEPVRVNGTLSYNFVKSN
jgi:protein TonB